MPTVCGLSPRLPRPIAGDARVSLLVLLLSIGMASSLRAQDFELYRPRTPEGTQGRPELPEEPPIAEGDERILVDELKGLILVDNPDQITPVPDAVAGVHLRPSRGLALLKTQQFAQIANRYLGGPVSIRRLNELAREIVLLYRANDRPVVDVSVPEQDISGGVVQIVVTEGHIGNIRINSCWFYPPVLASRLCIAPGQPIYESRLMEDLRYLNVNPFREVDLRLTPGDSYGKTDVIFDVKDRRPISGYVGYEDSGNLSTDLERTLYGVYWGNALGLDHSAGYQYTASPDFNALEVHSFSYSIPLPNRDDFTFWSSYATVNPDIAPGFDSTGYATQFAFRYYHDLYPGPCCPRGCLQRKLLFGFDFERTNANLVFGQEVVYNSLADVAQIVVGYESTRQTACRTQRLGVTGYYSPGGFSVFNSDSFFSQLQPGATAEYVYARAYLEETVVLPRQWQLYGKVTGQASDATLLSSQQLGFGGYNSIRGYDMRLVNGDQGWILNLEVRTPPLRFDAGCRHAIQGLAFCDYGGARRHHDVPGLDSAVDLTGVGLGLRYSIERHFSLRADYGWQLQQVADAIPLDSRLHLAAVTTF